MKIIAFVFIIAVCCFLAFAGPGLTCYSKKFWWPTLLSIGFAFGCIASLGIILIWGI